MWSLLAELVLGLLKWIFAEIKTLPADSYEDGEAAAELEASLKKRLAEEGWTEWKKTTGSAKGT